MRGNVSIRSDLEAALAWTRKLDVSVMCGQCPEEAESTSGDLAGTQSIINASTPPFVARPHTCHI